MAQRKLFLVDFCLNGLVLFDIFLDFLAVNRFCGEAVGQFFHRFQVKFFLCQIKHEMAKVVAGMASDEFDFVVEIGFHERLDLLVEFVYPQGVADFVCFLHFSKERHDRFFELDEILLMVSIEGVHGRTTFYRPVRDVVAVACNRRVLVFCEELVVVTAAFVFTFVEFDDVACLGVVEVGFEHGGLAHEDGTVDEHMLDAGIFVKIDGLVVGILKVKIHIELVLFVAAANNERSRDESEDELFHYLSSI